MMLKVSLTDKFAKPDKLVNQKYCGFNRLAASLSKQNDLKLLFRTIEDLSIAPTDKSKKR
jgi:hypothetical protein